MKTIPLTRGLFATVDDEDYERLLVFKWRAHPQNGLLEGFYAVRSEYSDGGAGRVAFMHHELLEQRQGFVVDHRSHDTLDNRKSNLRYATSLQNSHNRKKRRGSKSQFKGVIDTSACPSNKNWNLTRRWAARISANGKRICLGYFACELEAARAYNAAAIKYFGEFAWLNPV